MSDGFKILIILLLLVLPISYDVPKKVVELKTVNEEGNLILKSIPVNITVTRKMSTLNYIKQYEIFEGYNEEVNTSET